jgi:uncharacterized phage protein gp47/JayE
LLADLLLVEGGPGETIYLSEINETIAATPGLVTHRLILPTTDIAFATNNVPALGTVTFVNY